MIVSRSTHTSRRAPRSAQGGFTLIEVLVVVAIIALLISILLPSLAEARRQARIVVCASNLTTLGKATMFYAQASKDDMPAGWAYNNNDEILADTIGLNPWEFLYSFVQKPSLVKGTAPFATSGWLLKLPTYTCPDDKAQHTTSQKKIITPTGSTHPELMLSYGANLSPMYAVLEDAKKGAGKLSRIKRASDIVNMFDSGDDGNVRVFGGHWVLQDCIADIVPANNQCFIETHHKDGNNFLYLDGHVAFSKLSYKGPQYGLPKFPWAWVPNFSDPAAWTGPAWVKNNIGFAGPPSPHAVVAP